MSCCKAIRNGANLITSTREDGRVYTCMLCLARLSPPLKEEEGDHELQQTSEKKNIT